MKRWRYFLFLLALPAHSQAQAPQPNPDAPILAELVTALDAGRVKPDASVFLKVHRPWSSTTCTLPVGATVAGHVVTVAPVTQTSRASSITINFDRVDCGGELTPMQLTVITVVDMPPILLGRPTDADDPDNVLNANPLVDTSIAEGMAHSSLASSTLGRFASAESRIPTRVKPGEVIGFRGLTLIPGQASDTTSTLATVKHNVRLEKATLLILAKPGTPAATPIEAANTPASAAARAAAPAATGSLTVTTTLVSRPVPPVEVDQTSLCTDPCSLAAETDVQQLSPTEKQIATITLGFRQRESSAVTMFGYESTLTYLDPQDLLFTYDPHKLRLRSPLGFESEAFKTIRTVLLDPVTLKVKRMEEWQVQDEGQYLWRVGNDAMLAHIGHTLRFVGSGADSASEISVPGKLAFVSVSPSGNRIAVGVERERHTRQSHFGLQHELGVDPEEDVEVQLFDRDLKPLLHTTQSTATPPPVLSDDGQLLLNPVSSGHWRIQEQRWDGTQRIVANFQSNCKPALSVPQSGMVFVIGCSSNFENWYRVLRMDGHLLLTGKGTAVHTEECFTDGQGDLAVRTLQTVDKLPAGASYNASAFRGQSISLYRAKDGKPLFSVQNPGVSFARQSVTISPDGHQLAVLSQGNISLYAVKP